MLRAGKAATAAVIAVVLAATAVGFAAIRVHDVTRRPMPLRVEPGKVVVLRFEEPVEKAVIGDTSVARVAVEGRDVLVFAATGKGSTNLLVWTGRSVAQFAVEVVDRAPHYVYEFTSESRKPAVQLSSTASFLPPPGKPDASGWVDWRLAAFGTDGGAVLVSAMRNLLSEPVIASPSRLRVTDETLNPLKAAVARAVIVGQAGLIRPQETDIALVGVALPYRPQALRLEWELVSGTRRGVAVTLVSLKP